MSLVKINRLMIPVMKELNMNKVDEHLHIIQWKNPTRKKLFFE